MSYRLLTSSSSCARISSQLAWPLFKNMGCRAFTASAASRAAMPPPRTSTTTSSSSSDIARLKVAEARRQANTDSFLYSVSVIIVFLGATYAAVPLYQMLCQATGMDGTPNTAPGHKFDPASMKPVSGAKRIKITFESSLSDSMKWKFVPQTREISVLPGETALAFYTAYNPTDEDIVGISTYSVTPAKAAQYFNKIQCFCFEEQKLAAKEEVDMPVFFYLDPEFVFDPRVRDVNQITLHYTFFKSKAQ